MEGVGLNPRILVMELAPLGALNMLLANGRIKNRSLQHRIAMQVGWDDDDNDDHDHNHGGRGCGFDGVEDDNEDDIGGGGSGCNEDDDNDDDESDYKSHKITE